jgi:NitT/TauT family transport system substrate-binding protein
MILEKRLTGPIAALQITRTAREIRWACARMKYFAMLFLLVLYFNGKTVFASDRTTVRIGHFPNITHAQALVAHQMSRSGNGWFEKRLGQDVEIQWFVYNAGPAAMEAVFADTIDLTYVGPSPALNAYARSGGKEIRVIGGAAMGGAALVVQGDDRIKTSQDFRGKKIATPEFGNTQDVACRVWLGTQGFKITPLGGDAQVIPTANPDQLILFQRGDIDGAWTVEPWVSRLELEGKAKVYLEQTDAITTVLVCGTKFLDRHHDLVTKLVKAHSELTAWINQHPVEAQGLARQELAFEMKRGFTAELIERSWRRLHFVTEISREPFDQFLSDAQKVGFLRKSIDLSRLVEVP